MSKAYILSSHSKCKNQSVLSSRLVEYCTENGYELTKKIKKADIFLINTCGFNVPSQKESEALIQKILKKCPPGAEVCIIGCLVKINRETLEKKFPGLKLIAEPSQLDALFKSRKPFKENRIFHFDDSLFKRISGTRSEWRALITDFFIKILKRFRSTPFFSTMTNEMYDKNKIFVEIGSGCLNHCSYCVIKKARGVAVSRPVSDIIEELKTVYRKGLSINLVADDCGSYGYEIGTDLLTLLYSIDREYPGVPLELSYLHPRWLVRHEEAYLHAFEKLNITNINVPLQSGSDKVLMAMNRGYRAQEVLRVLSRIRKISPRIFIWGHFIYGHPTEQWEDFKLTLKALKSYDYFFKFSYSPVRKDDIHAGRPRNMGILFLKYRILEFCWDWKILRAWLAPL